MKKCRKFLKYLIAPLIVFVILSVVLYLEKLYPFGNNSLVQVDADYQYIPVLYRIYDFLHGNAGIIYDDIGLGNNIYISMIIQGSIFSPVNLLLYFTTRSNIINFFNILVVAKICLISLTTYIFINYKFRVNEFYKILFSILYSLSGWVLLNYFNIMWLDVIILFPLIVMFLDKLLLEGKYLGYIITLGLALSISYYISFFVMLFVLFYSCMYLILFCDKEKKKRIVANLGGSTVISILLSSFSLLPALYQTLISGRIELSNVSHISEFFLNKSLYLIATPLFIILFSFLITKIKKEKKYVIFYGVLFLLFILGLFFEPINLALHMGSHWAFPYRYSFITIFIMMSASLFYISKFNLNGKYNWYWIISFIAILIFGIYFNNQYIQEIIDSHIIIYFNEQNVFNYILVIFLVSLVLFYIAINFRSNILKYISISISSLFIIFVYASWTMYCDEAYVLTKNSVNINENINLPKDGRYKMNYTMYTPSYGFIYDVGTLDNWLHILPSNLVDTYSALGYETNDTTIFSYGGTVFSDWLLNFKYIISQDMLYDDIYTYVDEYDSYYLYKYNYRSGFGIEYDKVENIDVNGYRPFDLQNNISNNMFGKNFIEVNNYFIEGVEEYSISYNVKEKGFLYFYSNEVNNLINYVKINDKRIYNFDDYIKYLGIYEEDVEIYISFKQPVYARVELGFIKYDDIMNLNNSNIIVDNYLEVNSDGKNLFIPINNIPGLKIYNNSKMVNIDNYLGNYVSIKLDKGVNKIEINYEMPLFYIGIFLSFIGLILVFLYRYIPIGDVVCTVTYYLFYFLNILLLLYFYIYSFIKYMI